MPAGCEPIELRDPSGARVALDGRWTEVGDADSGNLLTWWLFSLGDCVWGSGQVEDVRLEGLTATPAQVQSLRGHIGSDFVIMGEILWLGPSHCPLCSPGYSPLRLLIEFGEAGQVFLREDREAGVRGPRCPDPQSFCPHPFLLERAE